MPARPRTALIGAGFGLVGLFLVWLLAFHVGAVARLDQRVLRGFVGLAARPHVTSLASRIAGLCDPKPFTVLASVPILVALLRRRPWLAVALGVMLLGANLSTQFLKPALATPRLHLAIPHIRDVVPASWPSGHATASMSLALALTLSVPARLRSTVAACGALFALAVCFSFLTLEWHYPSDVIGGFLIAFTWTMASLAGLLTLEARSGRGELRSGAGRLPLGEALAPPLAAAAMTVMAGFLILLARPHAVLAYAGAHRWFVAGATGIGVLALGLVTGLSLLGRR